MSFENMFQIGAAHAKSPIIVGTITILSSKADGHDDLVFRPDYANLAARLQHESAWDEVATAVLMAVAGSTDHADRCPLDLTAVIRRSTKEVEMMPLWLPGLVLGLFRGGIWLDENYRIEHGYYQIFAASLSDVLISTSCAEKAHFDPQLAGADYEQSLSAAVKKYVRFTGFDAYRRLEQMVNVLRRVRTKPRSPGSNDLNPFAEMVVKAISWAILGRLSPVAFGHAAELYVTQGMKELAGIKPAASNQQA